MARKLKAEGAIPVGSVAVPITRTDHELTSFIKMNELPTGFYTQSRIFCFLPLPVETMLPLHINGNLLATNERRFIYALKITSPNIPSFQLLLSFVLLSQAKTKMISLYLLFFSVFVVGDIIDHYSSTILASSVKS
jgi:hypothetical protein